MLKYLNLLRFFTVWVIISFVGKACNPIIIPTPSHQTEQTEIATPATSPNIPHTLSPSLTISHTWIPIETPTQAVTWTPAITLIPVQASIRMKEWLDGNPNCLFPCWAGITPGLTTWQEAKQNLGVVVNFVQIDEQGTCLNNMCNLIEWRSRVGFYVHGYVTSQSNNSIYSIIVTIEKPNSIYQLNQILNQYGTPEKAFIFTSTFLMPDELSFELTLAYPNHQFIITYVWDARKVGENVISCSQTGTSVRLSIKPIIGIWSDDLIKSEAYAGGDLSSVNLRPLEQVTDMTINQFYEKFKSVTGNECITTPVKYWGG